MPTYKTVSTIAAQRNYASVVYVGIRKWVHLLDMNVALIADYVEMCTRQYPRNSRCGPLALLLDIKLADDITDPEERLAVVRAIALLVACKLDGESISLPLIIATQLDQCTALIIEKYTDYIYEMEAKLTLKYLDSKKAE